jgi:hypothetical protein
MAQGAAQACICYSQELVTLAKTGEGQVVLIGGEAGIGKSRLTAALLEQLAAEPHTRLRYFCSPQHTDSALYPIIGQMERASGLTHDDPPQGRLDKLDALLAQTSTSIKDAALFADMLSLTNDGRYPVLELDPQLRRRRTLEALILQLEALTRSNPVLMIFEDAHWTDPTSLELFGRVVDRVATLPLLLIVTFRPEFDPTWIGHAHVTSIMINRLTHRDVGVMIDSVVGNNRLPASIRQEIIERTDGIPLFVEEKRGAGGGERGGGPADDCGGSITYPGGSREPACVADGPSRPTWFSQGGGADWGRDWSGVFPCPVGFGGAQVQVRAGIGARPSHSGWSTVPTGRPAACDLRVQACPGTGCGLWHAAARAEASTSRPHCRSP